MSDHATDDRALAQEIQAGSESAAKELFDKYCERLMRTAKRRIGQRMASRFDPEDVIQSAFRTFFKRVKNDEFTFEQEEDLFKLLVRLTVRKTLRQVVHHKAAKRSTDKEHTDSSEDSHLLSQLSGAEPTPDMEVTLLDEFEKLMNSLNPQERQVVEMKLQGFSTVEIAEKLGSYDRKIRRILERVETIAQGNSEAQISLPPE
jgi:RNA polymerase sigma factor (sigma-70 family)